MIFYVIHGRGHGHATRAQPIIGALRERGHRVSILVGQDVSSLFLDDAKATPVPSVMPASGWGVAPLVLLRWLADRRRFRDHGAQLVISDGDLPSMLAAFSLGLPSVALGHGLVFSHAERPPSLPAELWARAGHKAKRAAWTSTRQVVVNFVPVRPRRRTTICARPVLRPGLSRSATLGDEVVCYFRDNNGLPVLQALLEAGEHPVLFSDSDPRLPGVTHRPRNATAFQAALCSARAVVSSAGSQLISECATLGIPQFALFRCNDDEQRLNTAMLKAANLGDGTSFDHFDAPRIQNFLSSLSGSPRSQVIWDACDAAQAVCALADELLN